MSKTFKFLKSKIQDFPHL